MEQPERIVWQNLIKSSPERSSDGECLPGSGGGRRANASNSTSKLKRKDQHPVRKEFVQTAENQYRCLHCDWTTVMNATRMVKHIVDQCQNAPAAVREEIAAIQKATIEKERNSVYVAENKKDIHGLFRAVDNKRTCIFCKWTTVRNLTRMRSHIVSQCTEIPMKLKSLFIKKDQFPDEPTEVVQNQGESYQVYAVDESQWDDNTLDTADYDGGINEVNEENEHQEADDQQLGGSYLEIEELEERNCNYCGKAISYDGTEEDTDNEIFCSNLCLQRMDKTRQLTEQVNQVKEAKRMATRKRPINDPVEPEDQIPTKEFKLVLLSPKTSPKVKPTTSLPVQTIKTEKEGRTSTTMVEIVNYTIEHEDASSLSDTTSLPRTPARVVQKSPAKPAKDSHKNPITPVPVEKRPQPPPVVRSLAKETQVSK